MIFPSRSATSRHKSFSISPVGPIVPVSWPPWPGSITMRPILSPNTRVSECSPLRVGWATGAGPILLAWLFSESEGATADALVTLGAAGMASRGADALAERGSTPTAAVGGVCMRSALGAGVAGVETVVKAEAFVFALAAEFVGAALDAVADAAAALALPVGPYTSTTSRSG